MTLTIEERAELQNRAAQARKALGMAVCVDCGVSRFDKDLTEEACTDKSTCMGMLKTLEEVNAILRHKLQEAWTRGFVCGREYEHIDALEAMQRVDDFTMRVQDPELFAISQGK
jgi:hypothetical protein